ncbi:hypothetical protein BCR33DRAFT_853747, partial [Rhizoclosmatium globosum]
MSTRRRRLMGCIATAVALLQLCMIILYLNTPVPNDEGYSIDLTSNEYYVPSPSPISSSSVAGPVLVPPLPPPPLAKETKEQKVPHPLPPQFNLDEAKEECFRQQPSPCFFDFQWRPIPQVLIQQRSRHPKTNQWLPVKRPYSNHTRKLQLLYHCHYEHYTTTMDRFFYDEIDAAVTHPGINVSFWGPYFPGWNENISTIDNINTHFHDMQFDIIYSMDHWQSQFPTTAVAVSTIGDCHTPHTCQQSIQSYDDVIALRYAGEIVDLFRPEQWKETNSLNMNEALRNNNTHEYKYLRNREMPLFVHNPDCAPEDVFYPSKLNETQKWHHPRIYPAQLFGSTWGELYPLRSTIREGINKSIIFNATEFNHPGYNIFVNLTKPNYPVGQYSPKDPNTAHLRAQQDTYAKAMRETQICVFDSSRVRKAIRKYHEAFLSGCVVAADIPLEMEEIFRDVTIPLRLDMNAEEVNDILQVYLADKERLAWMAREAFYRARQHWTCRNKVDRLIESAARLLNGDKGYWFPFGFSAGCRDYP